MNSFLYDECQLNSSATEVWGVKNRPDVELREIVEVMNELFLGWLLDVGLGHSSLGYSRGLGFSTLLRHRNIEWRKKKKNVGDFMQQWISGNRAETETLWLRNRPRVQCPLAGAMAERSPRMGCSRWREVGAGGVTGAKCVETRLRVAAAIRRRSKERPKATTFSRALYEIELSPVMSLSD